MEGYKLHLPLKIKVKDGKKSGLRYESLTGHVNTKMKFGNPKKTGNLFLTS